MYLSEDKKYLCFNKEEIKKVKKISGHAFVELCGLSHFNPKGNAVLTLLGLYTKDVDKKYLYRGDYAEKIVQTVYARNHQIKVYDKKKINYDNFQDNKYFGGLVDIELLDESAYVEVKSKSLSKYDSINDYPPFEEIYQGLLYCILGNKDKLYMEWILFDPETEEQLFNNQKPTTLQNIKKISKEYNVKDYEEDVKSKMKEAFDYYLKCYKEGRISIDELSENCLKDLGFDVVPDPYGGFTEEDLPF